MADGKGRPRAGLQGRRRERSSPLSELGPGDISGERATGVRAGLERGRLARAEAVEPRRAVGAAAGELARLLNQAEREHPLAKVTLVQPAAEDRFVDAL